MTTSRENLLKVFRHETPEWVPLVGHVDPYNQPNRAGMDPALAEALGEVEWCDEGSVIFSRWLGLDIMDLFRAPVRSRRQRVTCERSVDGDTTTCVWHTPAGDLREVRRVCRDEATGAVSSNWTEHVVKGPGDLPALAALFEDEVVEADADRVEVACDRRRLIGDDGLLIGSVPGTPLGMMYRVYSGVEVLAYLCTDAPDALRDLFSVMEEKYLAFCRLAAQSEVDAVVSMDDTSTTAISPAMFESYNMGVTNTRAAVAHEHGKLYLHHSCGHIRDLLPLYRQTQMDAVHAFTVPPVGDVTIREGRERLGDRITIITGAAQLPGPMEDRAQVRASVRAMVEEARPWDHFVVNVAGYPNRTMEQTAFVVDCFREAGARRGG